MGLTWVELADESKAVFTADPVLRGAVRCLVWRCVASHCVSFRPSQTLLEFGRVTAIYRRAYLHFRDGGRSDDRIKI